MSVLGGWVLAPVVLLALCAGAGLLAERAARVDLPGPAIPGVGLAVLVIVAGLLTLLDATAELATPACALVAVAGFAVSRRTRVGLRGLSPQSKWAVGCGLGAYLLLAWPSVGSGQASVAGYIKLDDSAIWLGLIAHVMEHGRDISGVPPSTYQLDLVNWLSHGYPIGAFTPVGVTARLSGQDYANVYQPVIAVYGAIAALGLSALVKPLVGGPGRAALCGLVAVQASLFYGYAQWGSIKEIAAVALIPAVLNARRSVLLAAVGAGALLDVYGSGGIVWAAPAMAAVVLLDRRVLRAIGAVAVVAICAIPAIAVLGADAGQTTGGSPSNQEDIGKLIKPLDALQGAGLWPAGDFRYPPDPHWIAVALAVIGLVLAAAGVAFAVRRRAWELPAAVAVILVAAAAGTHFGGPWIDAKVLAITAPFLLLAAAVGARRGAVVVLLAALVSTWLVARDVYVTPRDELSELRTMGKDLTGRGPTLVLNYEGYGTRYFLGPAQDEGITDLRVNNILGRNGQSFPDYSTVEADDVDPRALFSYPVIVRRRTPVGSRTPSGYQSVHEGRFFEVWERDGTQLPTNHIGLGTALMPGAQLTCRQARQDAEGASRLVAAPRVNPVFAGSAVTPHDGRTSFTLTAPQAGVWRVWVGGSVLGHLRVSLDGHAVGSDRHQLDASVGWLRFDARRLAAGSHRVTLVYARGTWRPGRGTTGGQLPLGPVALSLETQPPLVRIPAAQVDRLCDGRTYDWLDTFK